MILRPTPWLAVPGGAVVVNPRNGAHYRVGQRDDLQSVLLWPDAPMGHLAAQRVSVPSPAATVVMVIAEEHDAAVALLVAAFPGTEVIA